MKKSILPMENLLGLRPQKLAHVYLGYGDYHEVDVEKDKLAALSPDARTLFAHKKADLSKSCWH